MSPNRQNISTLRFLVKPFVKNLDGVFLELAMRVKVPHHLTAPLLRSAARGWPNRQLEPRRRVIVRPMICLVTRPSLIMGNDGNHDLLDLLSIGNRLGGEVGDATVGNVDLVLAFVNNFHFRFALPSRPRRRWFGFRQVQQVTHALLGPHPTTLRRIAAGSAAVAAMWEGEETINRIGEVVVLLMLVVRG